MRQKNVEAMLDATQGGGGAVSTNSMLTQVAANKASGSKEAVLRKLLETQDTYIHELEAKCKAMSAQLLSPDNNNNFYRSQHGSPYKDHAGTFADKINLRALETSQESAGTKIDKVIQLLSQNF